MLFLLILIEYPWSLCSVYSDLLWLVWCVVSGPTQHTIQSATDAAVALYTTNVWSPLQ
jgi:hypothetical protein